LLRACDPERVLRHGFMMGTTVSAEFLARLRAFVRRRVRSDEDADDVVQDVAYKLVRQGDLQGSVHSWLFMVARRAIIDRQRARRSTVSLDDAPEPSAKEEGDPTRAELAQCLEPMLAALPEEDRSLLTRVDRNGESQSRLARELDVPISTVKSRVQRARTRLRKKLEDCCSIERDTRGNPTDYKRRRDRSCPCDPA
jgi:RNA polymerase sigma-70 factor, ECF subfamily